MTLNDILSNHIFQMAFAVFVAFLFYLKGKKTKNISYHLQSTEIVNQGRSLFPDLQIKWKDKDIEKNLTITSCTLWHSGNETINLSDMAEREPLSIISNNEDTIILQSVIQKQNKSANNFSIVRHEDNKSDMLNFDYIDRNNGIKVQVLHTGNSEHIELNGTIKGGKINNTNKWLSKKILSSRKIFFYSFIAFLLLIIFQAILFRFQNNLGNYFELFTLINGIVMQLIMVISFITFLWNEIIDSFTSIPVDLRDD